MGHEFNLNLLCLFLSSISIRLTCEQFEIDVMFDQPVQANPSSASNASGVSSNIGRSGIKSEANGCQNDIIPIVDSDDEDVVLVETPKIKPSASNRVENVSASNDTTQQGVESDVIVIQIMFDSLNRIDGYGLCLLFRVIEHLCNFNLIKPFFSLVTASNSDEPMIHQIEESNETTRDQSDSTDAGRTALTPVTVCLDRLDKATVGNLTARKTKTMSLKRLHKERMTQTQGMFKNRNNMNTETNGEKSVPKQSVLNGGFKCTVCHHKCMICHQKA